MGSLALDLADGEGAGKFEAGGRFVGAELRTASEGHAGEPAVYERTVVITLAPIEKLDRNALGATGAHHIAAERHTVAADQHLLQMQQRHLGQALLALLNPQPALMLRDETTDLFDDQMHGCGSFNLADG